MVVLAEPDPSDMVRAIQKAICFLPKIDPQAMHHRVSGIWKPHCHGRFTQLCHMH